VIPTNRSFEAIQPLLFSLCQQTIQPSQIVIVYDKQIESRKEKGESRKDKEKDIQYSENIKKYLSDLSFSWRLDIIDELSTPTFIPCQGASYVRNFGRSRVIYPLMMFVDDDNRLDSDACEKLFSYWIGKDSGSTPEWKKEEIPDRVRNSAKDRVNYKRKGIIVPLQSNHNSKILIPCLAQSFNYLLCRPRRLSQDFLISHPDRYCPLSFASSNCLVWPTSLFEQFPFDETIPFVYEDMILTGMMSQAWVEIVVDTAVTIHHDHAQRSKLAQMYIDTPQRAYYKAKHRIILVRRIASLSEKILFYTFGLWGHTLWLMIHVLWLAPMREWMILIRAIVRGTTDGCSVILR
jgi:hypothetical protein